MLKITQHANGPARRAIRLEGRLVGPWVDELHRVVRGLDVGTLRVELGGLAFADAAGVALLRGLRDSGAELAEASAFIATLIGAEP